MRPSTGYPRRRPSAGRSAAAGERRGPWPARGGGRSAPTCAPQAVPDTWGRSQRRVARTPALPGARRAATRRRAGAVVVVAERTARDEVSPAVEPEVIVDRLEGRLASRRLASATRIAPIPGHLPAPEPASRHSTRPVPGRFPRGSAASSGVRNPHPEFGSAPERRWSLRRDSNPGPLPYQGSALPPELRRPVRDPILLVRWPRHRGPAPAAGGGEEHRGVAEALADRGSSTVARAGRHDLARWKGWSGVDPSSAALGRDRRGASRRQGCRGLDVPCRRRPRPAALPCATRPVGGCPGASTLPGAQAPAPVVGAGGSVDPRLPRLGPPGAPSGAAVDRPVGRRPPGRARGPPPRARPGRSAEGRSGRPGCVGSTAPASELGFDRAEGGLL
jgi:hypothetical protein